MRKFLFLALTFFLSENLRAQDTLPLDELSQRLTYFYQNPDSTTLKRIARTLSASEAQEKVPPTAAISFCTSILLSRDANSVVLGRELKKHASTNQLFTFILSLEKSRDTLVNWPTHSPEVNDMMWGAYFGTGNSKYLERLISELKYINREDSLVLFLTGNSAKWSLCSNARQHQSIDKFIRTKMNTSPESLRVVLSEILTAEPKTLRDEFTARLKEMKAKGLIPNQNLNNDEPQISFVQKEKSSDVGLAWNDHRAGFVLESKSVKVLNDKGFFNVDGQIVQFVSIKIPSNMDVNNLTPEKMKPILQGYVQYEMQYFKDELKLEISELTSGFTTINEIFFIKWKFQVKSKENANNVNQQVYYTTICWDRVVSLNSPVTDKDNSKQFEKRLEGIAKTLIMK
jgi:hypothetical protein